MVMFMVFSRSMEGFATRDLVLACWEVLMGCIEQI